jgi:hypothetical protein
MEQTIMTINEFIATNPSRKEIAKAICDVANYHVLCIDDTFAWEPLSKLGGFSLEDFWDDTAETIARYEPEAVTHVGIVNYKLKEGVL